MEWYLILAFVLFGFGVVLLTAEFFLPTGGVLVVAAVGCFVLAVGLILYYGTMYEAVAAIIGLSVGLPIAGGVMFYGWRRLSLKSGVDSESGSATVISAPELAELEQLRGRHGRTVSFMRPSGTVEIDGRRIDALTEGMMLEPGVWVRCVDVRAGRVIVRQVEPPGDLSDMRIDDFN
jgi:membrane-bound serine protease (ClpP class)